MYGNQLIFLYPECRSTHLYVDSLVDFPDLYKKPHKTADDHDRVSLIVHNIQKNYDRLEDIEEHRPNREAFQCLATSPELDVWKSSAKPKKQT